MEPAHETTGHDTLDLKYQYLVHRFSASTPCRGGRIHIQQPPRTFHYPRAREAAKTGNSWPIFAFLARFPRKLDLSAGCWIVKRTARCIGAQQLDCRLHRPDTKPQPTDYGYGQPHSFCSIRKIQKTSPHEDVTVATQVKRGSESGRFTSASTEG